MRTSILLHPFNQKTLFFSPCYFTCTPYFIDEFCLTISSSAYYKTYCFAFQKRRFCKAKEPLLDGKTYAFAVPNRNYRFSSELSLQNKNDFHSLSFLILHCKTTMVLLYNRGIKWVFTINCYYIFRAVFSAKHLLNTTERLV